MATDPQGIAAPAGWHLTWARVALLGMVAAMVLLVAASIARHDLSVIENSMSYYALGPWSFLQTAAFVSIGAASVGLGLALFTAPPPSPWMRLAATALVVSGIAGIGLAAFPMNAPGPTTFIGDIHQTAGTIGGAGQLVAALAFNIAIRQSPAWQRFVWPATILFLLALTGAILTQMEIWWPDLRIPMGAAMRLVVIPMLILWAGAAVRLSNVARPTRSSAAT